MTPRDSKLSIRMLRRISTWTQRFTDKRVWWHLGHLVDALFGVAAILFFTGMMRASYTAIHEGALSTPPMATLIPGGTWGVAFIAVVSLAAGVIRVVDSLELLDLDDPRLSELEKRRRPAERARATLASYAAIWLALLVGGWLERMLSGENFDARGHDPIVSWMVYGMGFVLLLMSFGCWAIALGRHERGSVPLLERILYLVSCIAVLFLGLLFTLWAWLTSWGGALSITGVIADTTVAAGGNGLFMVMLPAIAGIGAGGIGIIQAVLRWPNPPVTEITSMDTEQAA